MPETTPEIFQLGRYWDDLVRGETTDATDLDPALPELIRQLNDLNRNIVPAPSFLNRIREDLMDASAVTLGHAPHALDELEDRRLRHARAARRPSQPKRRQPGLWAMTNLATAALLVLTLGSIFVAFSGNQLPGLIPAVPNTTEVPAATGVSSEQVLAVTFPSGVLPKTGTVYVDLYVNTMQPDYSDTVAPDPDDHGVNTTIMLDGTWAFSVEGSSQVLRADGTVEDVPPNTEVTLGTGDASLQLDTKPGFASHNPGNVPARVLGIEVRNPLNPSRFRTTGGISSITNQMYPGDWLKEGSVAVTVRRVTVAPGAALPLLDATVPTAHFIEAGTLTLKRTGAAAPATPRPERTYFTGTWTPWTKAPSGQVVEMRNAGEEPLVFLEVTVAPAGAETSAPATATPLTVAVDTTAAISIDGVTR